jgi:hypothetical protein
MSVGELFPLILFGISIMFSTILFLVKNKKQNLNEIRKTIREDSEKAIKSLEQKVVETEELVSLKQAEAQKTSDYVDRKIQELMDDGEELNQLGEALNKYRSMLAQLNLSTSKVEAFVIRTSGDARKLQELQHLIDSHEKKTYNILQSFDTGIKQQNFQLAAIKTEIVSQAESSINQIVTTRDDSLSEVRTQIEKYQELSDSCDKIQSTHNAILNELIQRQVANKESLVALNKEFEDKCDNYLNATKRELDEYLSKIQTSANDKLSLVEGSIVKNFEKELNSKREDTLLQIDNVLSSSVKTISLYDEKLNKSFENSDIISCKNINSKDNDSDLVNNSDGLINPKTVNQDITNSFNSVKAKVDLSNANESINSESTLDLFSDRLDRNEDFNQEEESQIDLSKKESKIKKKKRCKTKKSKNYDDDIDIMAGIDLIDLADGVIDSSPDSFSDDLDSNIFDEQKPLVEKVPKDIGDINLDDLASIDASFCGVDKKDIEEEIKEVEKVEQTKTDDEIKSLNENIDTNLEPIKKVQITKKLNGTGFGNLLNSYGSQKRVDDEPTVSDSQKTFKPGSIIEMLVDEDQLSDKEDNKEDNKVVKIDTPTDDISVEKEEIIDGEDKKKSSFVVIGEEEEILLD